MKARQRFIIVTADDFGWSAAVNEAVVRAHVDGILTTASVMVAAPAFEDAVARVQRLPDLKVGLHLVLVRGRALLPPCRIPHLADADGNLPNNLLRAGINFFFHPRLRAELEAEIRAQFEAYRAAGLTLDHVNAHNHMHLHPTVMRIILKVGEDYGLRAVRLPYEPRVSLPRDVTLSTLRGALLNFFLWPWILLLRRQLRGAGVRYNDYVFGINDSGNMNAELVVGLFERLPAGISEIYFHPSTSDADSLAPHAGVSEFLALTSPAVRAALARSGAVKVTFSDLAALAYQFSDDSAC